MKIDLHQVDAFTDQLFGGNPAGVVTNADGLSDEQMKKIAREMNLSETAFVLPSQTADVRLRFFTPDGSEIKFCGHATVGTLHQLAKLELYGLTGAESKTIEVETGAGVLGMTISRDDSGDPRVTFVAPKVVLEPYRLQGEAFAAAFSISPEALLPNGKILIDRKLNYVYVPIRSLKHLGSLQFDFNNIRKQFAKENIIVFSFFTNETINDQSDLHARGLAPLVGVDEDPFTGSSMAGVISVAKQNQLVDATKQELRVEQGNFIGRPGNALVRHNLKTNEIAVTAQAVGVFSTQLELQDATN